MSNATMLGARVPLLETDLPSIQLQHLSSGIDLSISLPESLAGEAGVITGYTEWTGRWQGHDLSVGWDWAFADEKILLLHPDELRSNAQVVGRDGVAASAARTRLHLAAWIETLPWREGAVSLLIQRNRRPAL